MGRDNVISGDLGGAMGDNYRKPSEKEKISDPDSDSNSRHNRADFSNDEDDFGFSKTAKKETRDIKESNDKRDRVANRDAVGGSLKKKGEDSLYSGTFGSNVRSMKFTSSSSIGGDIFGSNIGSARGNRVAPKESMGSKVSKVSKVSSDSSGLSVKSHESSTKLEEKGPVSSFDRRTNDDIFSDGYGSKDAGWMSAKRKFGEEKTSRVQYMPENDIKVSDGSKGNAGGDIFATNIATQPLDVLTPESTELFEDEADIVDSDLVSGSATATSVIPKNEYRESVTEDKGQTEAVTNSESTEMEPEIGEKKRVMAYSLDQDSEDVRRDAKAQYMADSDLDSLTTPEVEHMNIEINQNKDLLYTGYGENQDDERDRDIYIDHDERLGVYNKRDDDLGDESNLSRDSPSNRDAKPAKSGIKTLGFMKQDDSDLFG